MNTPRETVKHILSTKPGARIKLLGDSITHGEGGTGFAQSGYAFIDGFARNESGYCWANLFKSRVEEGFGCTVVNNACTGTDIQFTIDNFDTLVDEEDDLVICAIGTNDRHVCFDAGEKPTREELGSRFYNRVIELYGKFRDAGKEVIFVANIPASAENEQDGDYYWRILHMEDICAIYGKAAENLGFPLISLYELVSAYCAEKGIAADELLLDGLHPNDRGHAVMCALMLEALGLD